MVNNQLKLIGTVVIHCFFLDRAEIGWDNRLDYKIVNGKQRKYIKIQLNIESDLINTLFNELVTNHTILPYILCWPILHTIVYVFQFPRVVYNLYFF